MTYHHWATIWYQIISVIVVIKIIIRVVMIALEMNLHTESSQFRSMSSPAGLKIREPQSLKSLRWRKTLRTWRCPEHGGLVGAPADEPQGHSPAISPCHQVAKMMALATQSRHGLAQWQAASAFVTVAAAHQLAFATEDTRSSTSARVSTRWLLIHVSHVCFMLDINDANEPWV